MVGLRREVQPVIQAFRDEGVLVGRPFPPMTQHLRVSVGVPEEMDRFMVAFKKIMARRDDDGESGVSLPSRAQVAAQGIGRWCASCALCSVRVALHRVGYLRQPLRCTCARSALYHLPCDPCASGPTLCPILESPPCARTLKSARSALRTISGSIAPFRSIVASFRSSGGALCAT